MHEMAVVQGLMAILIAQAKTHEIGRVACVRLKIGRLRGLDARQICAAFEYSRKARLRKAQNLTSKRLRRKRTAKHAERFGAWPATALNAPPAEPPPPMS